MPIRINLKELFSSDSQDITIDKVNFNFNKLLELGIGELGLRGFSGIQGAAGPYGLVGPSGARGASWFVDSVSDPNTLTFQDLVEGDFYLDSVNFGVWQWNGSSWDFIFNLANIINNYLASSPSPFKRGLGYTGNHASQDDRFIMFNSRSAAGDALLGWSGNNSTNDVLFLNNFNETDIKNAIASFQSPESSPVNLSNLSTAKWYNSLLSIYVDHRDETIGRYHLELGTLYESPTSPSTPALTTVIENLKLRFLRNDVSLYTTHYNKALFSLDIPEVVNPTLREVNAIFEFATPAYDPSATSYQTSTLLGSKFGLDEVTGTVGDNLADGALFYANLGGEFGANIGIAMGYEIPDFPLDTGYVQNATTKHYFMLHDAANMDAIYLNDRLLQNGGNIIQVGTTQPREIYVENAAFTASSKFYGGMGIAVDGNSIYTIAGKVATTASNFLTSADTKYGYLNKFSIENPNHPVSEYSSRVDAIVSVGIIPLADCTTGMTTITPVGAGIADIDVVGEYAYVVNNHFTALHANSGSGAGADKIRRTYFQVISLTGQDDKGMTRVAELGWNSRAGSTADYDASDPAAITDTIDPLELNGAWRVKVKGKHAIVARNGMHTRGSAELGGFDTLGDPSDLTYSGGIAAIDISNPTAPIIVASAEVGALTNNWNSAILDMKVVDDKAYTIAWEQDFDSGKFASVPYNVQVHVFDLEGLDSPNSSSTSKIEWYGKSTSALISGTTSGSPDLPNYGAIEVNHTFIFAGYEDTIYLFKRAPTAATPIAPCYYRYTKVDDFTLDFTGLASGVNIIYDMHHVGNSLYVLASAADAFNVVNFDTDKYYIFKLDVSGLSQSSGDPYVTPTQVWVKELPGACTRFKVVGKHIYASVITHPTDDTDKPSLVAIDFDGIYTSGAHIESLRADQIHTTRDLTVGGRFVVNDHAELGGGAHIEGNLGVAGDIVAKTTHVKVRKESSQTISNNVSEVLTFSNVNAASLNNFPNNNLSYYESDMLAEWLTDTFTARNSGFYQFVLHLVLEPEDPVADEWDEFDRIFVNFIITPGNAQVAAVLPYSTEPSYSHTRYFPYPGLYDATDDYYWQESFTEQFQMEPGDSLQIEVTISRESGTGDCYVFGLTANESQSSRLYINKLI
jgi:hypothetical protein